MSVMTTFGLAVASIVLLLLLTFVLHLIPDPRFGEEVSEKNDGDDEVISTRRGRGGG